jgi:hypothetical protein
MSKRSDVMAGSEIARILQQIRDEEEAAIRAFYDFAMVGRHDFINAKMAHMDDHVDALGEILGSRDEAMKMVIADQMEREIQQSAQKDIS